MDTPQTPCARNRPREVWSQNSLCTVIISNYAKSLYYGKPRNLRRNPFIKQNKKNHFGNSVVMFCKNKNLSSVNLAFYIFVAWNADFSLLHIVL